ncbi:FtsX-like permease family protein [Clostridium sp. KNHs205]|uniref:FtsX-like permease family protein n=1 Tax=Clostridium sp. KNHs205 TaxID=1449050 RepID=UPI00051B6EFA|nr:FtsX-like permease family protein [Clostridium sp. KNHs205]
MQKILRKRVFRELKSNIFRYLALGSMIVLGMYLVVSLVGAADTVITQVDEKSEESRLEEGEFSVFVPLTKAQEKTLEDKGISLERMFYQDFKLADGSTLRSYANRKNINLIVIDKGRAAQKTGEAVIEKRYSEEHGLQVGGSLTVGSSTFTITGIGTVPDYDAVFQNFSDSSVDSKRFGLFFVTEEAYQELNASKESIKSEEYVYGYRLNGKLTNAELKAVLQDFEFLPEEVEDASFQEYWKETAGKLEELQKAIQELNSGTDKLATALNTLSNNNRIMTDGAEGIFAGYLTSYSKQLNSYGLAVELTKENYNELLTMLIDQTDNEQLQSELMRGREQLRKLEDFTAGIASYTDGVKASAEGSADINAGTTELNESTDTLIKDYKNNNSSNLIQFITSADNPRIKASSGDQIINKYAGLIAGVIVMILFTFVISVFVSQGIKKENSVIGALYALGARKKDLMLHYLSLPVVVTLLAGIIGTLLGFSKYGVNLLMSDCYRYYSVPEFPVIYPLYLVLYGVVMPPFVAALVNCLVINKKLSEPALKLIRNEQKNSKTMEINLGEIGFIGSFRIRQMLREARTGITVIFGLFISLLIVMLGLNTYTVCNRLKAESKADTRYEYMYTYKYPEAEIPSGGEAGYTRSFSKEIYGYDLEVTLLGIDKANPYFDIQTEPGKNKVIISTAMAQKYHLKTGDKLIVTDKEDDQDYAFTITGITQYSVGLYVFMDINSMRELFGQKEDFYNVIFSDKALDMDSGRLYAVTTKEDIIKSAEVFIAMMLPMIQMLIGVSAIILGIVMYLMLKVMIEHSAYSIALMKIFGYRGNEIRKLYLNGNFYTITVGAAFCIPLAKKVMDGVYPLLISNVACGVELGYTWSLYTGIFLGIILLYFLINQMLMRRVKQMTPALLLKERE